MLECFCIPKFHKVPKMLQRCGEKFLKTARFGRWLVSLLAIGLALGSNAEESVCSKVKLEIPQELTLERQGFEATMKITNGSPDPLNAVKIEVLFKDNEGNPVLASNDPNAVNAKFFIRESSKELINAVDGTGSVASGTTAVIKWLIIPAPGAAGNLPTGKLYKIGAKLDYTLKGEAQSVDVIPDSITVNPMPSLALDYFLPLDVLGDEPFTPEIEAPVPFSLGVRVKNSGFGDAAHLKIESAQPKIIENKQGLQVNFRLLGSQVQDKAVNDGLLLDFGTIGGKSAACGRWTMESSLSGKMTDFTATFTHDDALGGRLTSLIQTVRTHTLLHDVRLDSPGKDNVREFLAQDTDAVRLYDSDGSEAEVIDISSQVSFDGSRLQVPAVPGIFYASLPVSDSLGAMLVSQVRRADGRVPPKENVWISKVRNPQNGTYQSFLNIFDYPVSDPVTGEIQSQAQSYDLSFAAPVSDVPVLSVPGTQVVAPNQRVTFTVAASAPNGASPVLTATPLYAGASFQNGIFDWTPSRSGSYPVSFSATANGKTVTKTVLIVAAVNEAAVAFASNSAEVVENAGKAEVVVTLDQPCSETVSVQVNAAPGSTAQLISDYLSLGTVSFAPGETSKKLMIELNDDLEAEPTEILKLHFGDITHGHAAIPDAVFDLTIKDDDLVGALSLVQGDQVIKVNPSTGATISVLARDIYLRAPTGFVWNQNGELLVASSSGRILAFDRAGKVHDELHPAVSLGQTGKLQIDAQGRLWTLSRFDETCRLFCLNTASGEVIRSIDMPLACTDFQVREDGQVAVLSPDTLTLVGSTANVNVSLPSGIHPSLLALDGNGDLLLAGGGAIHRYKDSAFSLVQEDATLDQLLALTWQQAKIYAATAQFVTSYNGSSAAAVVQLGNSPQLALAGIKPAFLTGDLAVVAEEGDVIHLRARAEGTPSVSHEWRLNDSPAAQGAQLDLTLEAAQDGASLVCVAKNALGEVRSQSVLKVYKHLLAAADTFDAQEDQELTGNILSNDEARDAKAVLNELATHGNVELREDGSFTWHPANNYHGSVTFTYHLERLGRSSALATVTLNVSPVDDAPVATAIPAQTVLEDAAVSTLDLAAYFSDVDGDSLSYSLVSSSALLDASLTRSVLHFQPKADANGTVTLKVRASANGQILDADLVVTVTPVDDAPVALAIPAQSVLEDAAASTLDLRPYFSDVDGDALSFELVSLDHPELLSASVSGSSLSFQPKPDANGTATLKVRASANGKSVDTDLVINVTPVDDAPVIAQSIPAQSILEDAAVSTLDLSLFFKDVDGDTLSYSLVSGDALLTASISASSLSFQPKTDVNGNSSLTVKATANGKSVETTLSVVITPVDDAPTIARTPVIPELRAHGTVRIVNIAGIFTDKDNDVALITTAVNGNTQPSIATAVLANATDLMITPLSAGQTIVTLRGSSGGQTCDLPLTLTVLPSLQVQPQPDIAQVDKGGTVSIDILANDGPGLTLANVVITKLRNGEVSFNHEQGILTFHHNPILDGATGFAYALKDPTSGTLSAPVWVDITVIDNDHFPINKRMPKGWNRPDGAKAFWRVDHKTTAFEGDLSLCSKTIKDKQSSAMEFTGRFENGNITFAAKVSSKVGDRLLFSVDGIEKQSWTGLVDWTQVSVPVAEGLHTLTWAYVKDNSGKAGEDRAWVDAVKLPLWKESFPGPDGLPDAWLIPEGMKPFTLNDKTVFEGCGSMESGNVGNKKASGMRLTADFSAGDLGFLSKVSSQLNSDFLEFWVDDTKIQGWSGEQAWAQKYNTLTVGRHTLTWIYRKDDKGKAGKDAAWVDGLTLPTYDLRFFSVRGEVAAGEGSIDPDLWVATDGQKLTFSCTPAPGWKLAEARLDDGTLLEISDCDDDDSGEVELPALRRDTIVKFKFVKVKK